LSKDRKKTKPDSVANNDFHITGGGERIKPHTYLVDIDREMENVRGETARALTCEPFEAVDVLLDLQKHLDRLTGFERILFTFVYIEGFSARDFSEATGIPVGDVRIWLKKIKFAR